MAMTSSLFSLVLLVAILGGAVYWLQRRNRLQTGQSGRLRVVSAVALGPRERMVLVEADGHRILVGVGPGMVGEAMILPSQNQAPAVSMPAAASAAETTPSAS